MKMCLGLCVAALIARSPAAAQTIDLPAISDPDPIFYDISAHYPRESIERREQGMATVTFEVNAKGAAENCRVEGSTGFPALDAASCPLIESALYLPEAAAIGEEGHTRRLQRIRWVLPR